MIKIDTNAITKLIPKASEWIKNQEFGILIKGRNLNSDELDIAKKIGIKNYDKIKIFESSTIPKPKDIMLLEVGKQLGLINAQTSGICFRYGIFIHENGMDKKATLVHELIHTLQYERFGSIELFLTQYSKECLELGYENSTLELEAIMKTKEFNFVKI